MDCPKCAAPNLQEGLSANGIVIDTCSACKGIWFDGGELEHFVKDAATLQAEQAQAFARPAITSRKCPRCRQRMHQAQVLSVVLDSCPNCRGVWTDAGEIEQLNKQLGRAFTPDAKVAPRPIGGPGSGLSAPPPARPRRAVALAALPNLFVRSFGVLAGLYGILAGFLGAAVYLGKLEGEFAAGLGLAICVVQFIVSPWLMDLMLRWVNGCRWTDASALPETARVFLSDLCLRHGMPLPRVGVIEDGNPNAFTYGHYPGNARLVVTRGLLGILDPRELNAVLAHEIGHVVHWDMLVMTIAAIVPYLLYLMYKGLVRATRGKSSGKNDPRGALLVAALVALALYYVTSYMLLFLSRVRELYADRFAGEETGDPGALASALVKVAYGLAGGEKEGQAHERRETLEAVRAFGIFDPTSARALVASSLGLRGGCDADLVKGAMQWDLWNPWAGVYELQSTHPLPAKRIEWLGLQAEALGQEPYVRFDLTQPESYWDEFFVDLVILWLPWIGAAAAFFLLGTARPGVPVVWVGAPLAGFGLGYLARLCFAYGWFADFSEQTVASLLRKVKVSKVRTVRATLRGRVIGRGDPGNIFSEDFTIRDQTGLIVLDYSQPVGLMEMWFALVRRAGYAGKDIIAHGYYRRAPVPYIELRSIECMGQTSKCWTLEARFLFGLAALIGGLWLRLIA